MESESKANREALARLDSAMFVLSLDDEEVNDEVQVTHKMLHNYGANRFLFFNLRHLVTITLLFADGLTSHSI